MPTRHPYYYFQFAIASHRNEASFHRLAIADNIDSTGCSTSISFNINTASEEYLMESSKIVARVF